MTLVELLTTLRHRNINLWVDGERLRYSAPPGALTPGIRQDIAEHKAELLVFLNETQRIQRVSSGPITKISREEKLLPSINQKRLWFIDQLGASSAYNLYKAFRVKGTLNLESLEQSVNEIIRRHEILRTTFPAIEGQPLQVINPAKKLRLSFIDLGGIVDTMEQESEAMKILTEEVERPLDLTKGPLFRCHLLRLNTEEYFLLFTMHHIVADGWSLGILVKELTVLYEAFCKGSPSPLPELTIQYADFAHWQSEWLQGDTLQQELSHWKERLKDAPEITEILTDYPRPDIQSFQGASEPVAISKNLTEGLKTLSKHQGVSLFMVILAAFKTLIFRYTGCEDLILGSPIAGRPRGDLENLIGLFINTLVLRTDLSGNPTFRELLVRIREVALEAYEHQEVPFEKLIEDLDLERSLSVSSLFQMMFVLQNTPESQLTLLDLTVSPVKIKTETALFELFFFLKESNNGLIGTLSYRTELFDRETISRLISRFQVLLNGLIVDPDQPITTLPFLIEGEKQQLFAEWNATEKDYSAARCIHELFELQIERAPEAVALILKDQQLTYRELNSRANQLAHYLKKLGVGPDILVGICMEPSLETVIALLGILKAGGAYVPLDPQNPKHRLAFLLKNTQVSVILTQRHLVTDLPDHQAEIVCLDSKDTPYRAEIADNPASWGTADSLAYVIYTSGSTGVPKGVMISHRGLFNRLLWEKNTYRSNERDRLLQVFSLSFDFGAWEIFFSLMTGTPLIMAEPGRNHDSHYLVGLIVDANITITGCVPSMLNALLNEPNIHVCNSLRRIISGGEVLPIELQEYLFDTLPNVQLENTYGPTEASIDVTCWVCKSEPASQNKRQRIPIGRPIANTKIYILDAHQQAVPIGVPGEISIAGIALARGYLMRPDLTAERFVPNPYSNKPGERLYKTGDAARYRTDGNIEFLERIDDQVKIRGFRIELGEIESVLAQDPSIQEVVVLAQDDVTKNNEEAPTKKSEVKNLKSNKRLVAYVVPTAMKAPTVVELRKALSKKLPGYMVPSVFVFLKSLPRTSNGKLNKKALPVLEESRPVLENEFVAPRTLIELILSQIWAEVLRVDKVGIYDNFFELGGHSLIAIQIVSLLRANFDLEISLLHLFEHPTIEGLAERIMETPKMPELMTEIQSIFDQGTYKLVE